MGLCNPASLQGRCAEDVYHWLRERCVEGRAGSIPGLILAGNAGCGKKTLVQWAAERLGISDRIAWFHPWSAATAVGLENGIIRAAISGALGGMMIGTCHAKRSSRAKILVLRRAELWATRREVRSDVLQSRGGEDTAERGFTFHGTWAGEHARHPYSAIILIVSSSSLDSRAITALVRHPTSPWRILHVDKLMLRSVTETAKQLATRIGRTPGEGNSFASLGVHSFDSNALFGLAFSGDVRDWLRKAKEASTFARTEPEGTPSAEGAKEFGGTPSEVPEGAKESALGIQSTFAPSSAPSPAQALVSPGAAPHIPSIFVVVERILLGTASAHSARQWATDDPRVFYMLWANAPLLGNRRTAAPELVQHPFEDTTFDRSSEFDLAAMAADVVSEQDARHRASSPWSAAAFAAWKSSIDGYFHDERSNIFYAQPPHGIPLKRSGQSRKAKLLDHFQTLHDGPAFPGSWPNSHPDVGTASRDRGFAGSGYASASSAASRDRPFAGAASRDRGFATAASRDRPFAATASRDTLDLSPAFRRHREPPSLPAVSPSSIAALFSQHSSGEWTFVPAMRGERMQNRMVEELVRYARIHCLATLVRNPHEAQEMVEGTPSGANQFQGTASGAKEFRLAQNASLSPRRAIVDVGHWCETPEVRLRTCMAILEHGGHGGWVVVRKPGLDRLLKKR